MNTTISPDVALQKLINDHRRVQDLFTLFEEEDDAELRHEIGQKAINALTRHALLEETLLYPIAQAATGEDALVEDHREEHQLMKSIIAEAKLLRPGRDFDRKFRSLISIVKSHIEKEEGILFPLLEKSGVDLKKLGRKITQYRPEVSGSSMGVVLVGLVAAAGAYYWLSQRPNSHSRP